MGPSDSGFAGRRCRVTVSKCMHQLVPTIGAGGATIRSLLEPLATSVDGGVAASEDWIGAAIARPGGGTEVLVWRWDTDPDSGASVDI